MILMYFIVLMIDMELY